MHALQDLQGKEAALGRCVGRGGEGAVYSVPTRPRLVAKIYARTPDEYTSRKLAAMVQLGTEALASFAAWPQNLLLDERTGNVVGFLMPRVEGHREIHALYGPTNRKTAFPDATWAFLMRAARNVAAAFDTVHQHGHVIGDVNQGNIVVSRKAGVRLIDCDSFQITHLGRTYPCRVGVPLFTPPELQGQRLEDVIRTPDHDRFGLAVLVFHLLFMGRHPFAGRHPERAIPVETAIREGLFAFGWEAARQGWEPPPFSLRLSDVPASLAQLFERAFGKDAAAGGSRPAAAEWVGALDELEATTVICGEDPRHVLVKVNGSCPWCRIEQEGGPSFFFMVPGAAPDAFDLTATWRAIEAVRPPGPAERLQPPSAKGFVGRPLPPELRTVRAVRLCLLTLSLGFGGVALWQGHPVVAAFAPLGLLALERTRAEQAERERRRQAVEPCEAEVRRVEAHWEEMCGDAQFSTRRQELEKAKLALEGLHALEESEWTELAERFREMGFLYHLKSFALEFSRIPGLGPAELGSLAGSGLTTSADVTPEALMAIGGIDLDLVKGLLLFKEVAARSFTFDPVTFIPGRDQKTLANSQAKRREELLKTLQAGAIELAELRRQVLAWRDALGRARDEQYSRLAQLRADAREAERIA